MSDAVSVTYRPPDEILETVLYCPDLDAAGEFYERILGLSLLSYEPNRHRFYQLGHSMLLVFQPSTTAQATAAVADQVIPKHGAHGPGHLAFAIAEEQIEVTRRRLVEHAIPIECEIAWPRGGYSIYCRDPAGNSIEFATRRLWFPEPS